MSTPLFSAVDEYVEKDMSRFHMPGHKGFLEHFEEISRYDITEVLGCDELYRPRSAIAELEARYARLYKSDASLLCAGGATLCIQTMLALAAKPGDKIILARGCHAAAVNAMALLDINPVWVFPDHDKSTGLANPVTATQLRQALLENRNVKAVYITSPDYYGILSDIKAISEACREFGVPLLVDNAHGAHLKFLTPSMHPISLGADMCADSLHKTLPVLTGGAMLHIKNPRFIPDAKRYMSIFGSTSPSYLIMLSADTALETLERDFAENLAKTAEIAARLENLASLMGFTVPKIARDPLKLALGFYAMGYTRNEFSSMIRQFGIEPEMIDAYFCVLMLSPYNTDNDFARLESFIKGLEKKPAAPPPPVLTVSPKQVMGLRESVLADAREVTLENALGKTAGTVVSPCPPGIPVVIPGEVIDKNLTLVLKRYGISRLNVII